MKHLAVKTTPENPHGTACGTWGDGDSTTCRTQMRTCSLCEMHIREHEEYLRSLRPQGGTCATCGRTITYPGYLGPPADRKARAKGNREIAAMTECADCRAKRTKTYEYAENQAIS